MNPLPTASARFTYLLLALVVGFLTSMGSAQERPFDASVCALVLHPEKYNEGLVSVEGFITVGPEEFMLHDATCGDEHGRVWLEFGGDIASPATAATPHRAPGKARTFDGAQLPLTKDRDFDALQKLLQGAQKSGTLRMFRATLVGKYFAGHPTKTASGQTFFGGYGHLECCSLLVVEEVAKVESELQAPVDFSPVPGTPPTAAKGCTVTDVAVPPREDEDQLQRKHQEDEYRYLDEPKKVAARAIAVQQDMDADAVEKHLQTDSTGLTQASYTWQMSDGLTTYHVLVNKPYWLWQTAQSGDAVIWVPKKTTKTECVKPATKLNIPIKH